MAGIALAGLILAGIAALTLRAGDRTATLEP
jgi:hypothetical protein